MGNKNSNPKNNKSSNEAEINIPVPPSNNQANIQELNMQYASNDLPEENNSMQYNQVMYNQADSSDQSGSLLTKIPQKDDPTKPVFSVIVTSYSGSSYDDLFRQVPQVAPGGRICLYSLNLNRIEEFFTQLLNPDASPSEEIKSLATEMRELSPDAVLFNFECCSGCSSADYHFPQREVTIKLINYLLEKGHMVMCSDFAVKALINDWDASLGPNPFVKVGECTSFIELFFLPKNLEESPSKQLQMVGQLCQTGKTTIHALGGTVVFGINKKNADNQNYNLSVLTIVTKTSGDGGNLNEYGWTIEDKTGTVGHALLKYKSGGILILSAGHWIELSNLNVNVDNLAEVAMKNYGADNEYMQEINEIKSMKDESQRETKLNRMANMFVQQTAACNYSSSKK